MGSLSASLRFCDNVLATGPEPVDGPEHGLWEYRSVGRGANEARAETLHDTCSESEDMDE